LVKKNLHKEATKEDEFQIIVTYDDFGHDLGPFLKLKIEFIDKMVLSYTSRGGSIMMKSKWLVVNQNHQIHGIKSKWLVVNEKLPNTIEERNTIKLKLGSLQESSLLAPKRGRYQ